MTTTAFLPEGTKFLIGDGATPTEAFVEVANCKSIAFSGAEAEEIDVTNLSSTNRYKEFIAGFKDAGQIELGIHFNPEEATHAVNSRSLYSLFISGVTFNWKVEFPVPSGDTCTLSGRAFIRSEPGVSFSPTSPLDGTDTVRRSGGTAITVG